MFLIVLFYGPTSCFDLGTYVLVITSCKEVGTYLGFPIFRVMSLKFLACNKALELSTSEEV